MSRCKHLLSFFFLSLYLGLPAWANIHYQLGNGTVDGNGCPSGTARAIISPDGSTISIMFDQFSIARSKGVHPYSQLRQFCHFHIPVDLEKGFNLLATDITYRGYAVLSGLSIASIYTTGSLLNQAGYLWNGDFPRTLLRNTNGDFTITQKIPVPGPTGRCQPRSELDFNTFIQLSGGMPRNPGYFTSDAQVSLDTADLGGYDEEIIINVKVVPCT